MKLFINLIFALVFIVLGALLTARFEFTNCADAQQVGQVRTAAELPTAGDFYDTGEGHSRFAVIAKRALPAVVNIKTERSVEYHYVSPFDRFFEMDPFFEDFFGRRSPQRQQPRTRKHVQRGEGSGFIYSSEGYIMTNNHVVEKADRITVRMQNGDEFDAEIIGNDPETDLAVIRINRNIGPEEVLDMGDSDALWVGDWVIAIGSPYSLEQTVTVGVVSAKGRSGLGIRQGPVFQDFIQTDAAINPGNSGGPLLNIRGEVIGINAAVNAQAQGIGFAIPVNMARVIAENLKTDGRVRRAYLGIMPRAIGSAEKEVYGLKSDQEGVLIASVEDGTPAAKHGLEVDDVILEMDGRKIRTVDQFRFDLASYAPGSSIDFKVLRRGRVRNIKVTLGDRSEFIASSEENETAEKDKEEIMGLELKEINEETKKMFNISVDNGVIVTDIADDSVFRGKLQSGDVIERIIVSGEHLDINGIEDFRKAASMIEDGKRNYVVRFVRAGRSENVLIRP